MKFWIPVARSSSGSNDSFYLEKKYPGPYPVVLRYEDEKKAASIEGLYGQKNEKLEDELRISLAERFYR